MPVSFSHRGVGSSILDFLNEEPTTYTEYDEMLQIATSATTARAYGAGLTRGSTR